MEGEGRGREYGVQEGKKEREGEGIRGRKGRKNGTRGEKLMEKGKRREK